MQESTHAMSKCDFNKFAAYYQNTSERLLLSLFGDFLNIADKQYATKVTQVFILQPE